MPSLPLPCRTAQSRSNTANTCASSISHPSPRTSESIPLCHSPESLNSEDFRAIRPAKRQDSLSSQIIEEEEEHEDMTRPLPAVTQVLRALARRAQTSSGILQPHRPVPETQPARTLLPTCERAPIPAVLLALEQLADPSLHSIRSEEFAQTGAISGTWPTSRQEASTTVSLAVQLPGPSFPLPPQQLPEPCLPRTPRTPRPTPREVIYTSPPQVLENALPPLTLDGHSPSPFLGFQDAFPGGFVMQQRPLLLTPTPSNLDFNYNPIFNSNPNPHSNLNTPAVRYTAAAGGSSICLCPPNSHRNGCCPALMLALGIGGLGFAYESDPSMEGPWPGGLVFPEPARQLRQF